MTTPAAQALMDARAALDAAKALQPDLRATTVAAQVAEDTQAQLVQQSLLAYEAAIQALLIESGNQAEEQ